MHAQDDLILINSLANLLKSGNLIAFLIQNDAVELIVVTILKLLEDINLWNSSTSLVKLSFSISYCISSLLIKSLSKKWLKAFWLALAGVFKFGVTGLFSWKSSKFSCEISVGSFCVLNRYWSADSAKEEIPPVNEPFDHGLPIQYFRVETIGFSFGIGFFHRYRTEKPRKMRLKCMAVAVNFN